MYTIYKYKVLITKTFWFWLCIAYPWNRIEGLERNPWNLLVYDYNKMIFLNVILKKAELLINGVKKTWIAIWKNKIFSVRHILPYDKVQMCQI